MENETPVRLAYEASVRAISDQAGVLESLRSRARTMFAAAALVTSFLGGQALSEARGLGVWSLSGVAVAAFVLAVNYDDNADRVKPLIWCFGAAIIALLAEVAAWIAVFWEA